MRQLPKNKIITIAQLTILACAPLLFAGGGDLSLDTVDKIRMEFKTDSHTRAMYNSITNNEVRDLALNRDVLRGHNKIYSHKIKTKGVTNQKSSGRCWLFAGLNVMRPAIIKKYKLDEFEFSQNYLAFWDKMEKANLFLERIIGFAERDIMDRDMVIILKYPCQDGGDWEYVTYLIKKYGAVPKDIMPKTNSSSSTGAMNKVLSNKLRADAAKLRMMSKDGKSIEQLRAQKKKMLADIYKILVLNLGEPVKEFKWRYEYKDKDGKSDNNETENDGDDKDLAVSELRSYTPKSFYAEFVGVDLDEYVDIFNDPAKKFGKLYRGRMTKSAYDNEDITYANVDIGTIKSIVQKSILDDEPVWFGADVGKQQSSEHGIMAVGLYDYNSIYNIDMQMTKAQRRLYHQTSRNHAMLFVGVDVVEGKTVKWRVENSWGDEDGSEGYWALYDQWFDEHVFNVIVHKKYVPDNVLKIYEQTPIMIEPWDSMLLGR